MPRPLKWSILGAHTIILSKIFIKSQRQIMWGSNFYESDVTNFMIFDATESSQCYRYQKTFVTFDFFCKNEACVNSETHKRH